MTFYQELQLNQAGSKNLLKKSETLKEKPVSYTHLVQDLGHFLLLYEIHLPDRTCQIFWILHHPLFLVLHLPE